MAEILLADRIAENDTHGEAARESPGPPIGRCLHLAPFLARPVKRAQAP